MHPSARTGFSRYVGRYEGGRPDYPAGIKNWLEEDLQLRRAKVVLDLGAGTGKLTKRLLAIGLNVIAVEPASAMIDELKRKHPGVDAREGIAEQIPCADAAVDAVVCAQAFHWFANNRAVDEIYRVLKPGGHLGLLWNVRDETVRWVAQLTRIIDGFEGDAPRYRTFQWRDALQGDAFISLPTRRFAHEHIGMPERVIVDRTLSVSFIAALPEAHRRHVADQVRQLIASSPELAARSTVTFPYETVAYTYRKK